MKFSDNPAKSSAPGRPVTWRLSNSATATASRPMGMIGQDGESAPVGYLVLADGASAAGSPEELRGHKPAWSEASAALVAELTALRESQIHDASA